jgi:propionyl-CoA carboxylase beta chain
MGTDITAVFPTAEIAIMGPEGAANVLYKSEIEKAADPQSKRMEKIQEYREEFANPYYAAERGWVDEIIDPKDTRQFLIRSLERLKNKAELRPGKRHGTIPL